MMNSAIQLVALGVLDFTKLAKTLTHSTQITQSPNQPTPKMKDLLHKLQHIHLTLCLNIKVEPMDMSIIMVNTIGLPYMTVMKTTKNRVETQYGYNFEVRRGADRAEIYSLAFSANAQWLAVSSDKGTVHVFSLKFNSGMSGNENIRSASDPNLLSSSSSSSLSFIRGVLPKYFSSEWSVAQFRLHEGSQYIVAFGHQKNTVVILGMDGSFYRCQFDPTVGGEMTQLECYNFLKPEEAF